MSCQKQGAAAASFICHPGSPMPRSLNVAFWNVNTGSTSPRRRREVFGSWVELMEPDLLFLEETGNSWVTSGDLLRLTGMKIAGHAETLNVAGRATSFDLVALQKDGLYFRGGEAAIPGLTQRRDVLMVEQDGMQFVSIHANASWTGGRNATAATAELLNTNGPFLFVGGDFNCPIGQAPDPNNVTAVRPKSWNDRLLSFTQWRKTAGTTRLPARDLYMPSGSIPDREGGRETNRTYYNMTFETHDVIDFVMYNKGDGRDVTALPNAPNEAIWSEILREFDHCPVVYRVTK